MKGILIVITKFCVSILLAAIVALPAFAEEEKKPDPFTITSTATLDEGAFPVMYTCDGKDISPELTWTGQPAKLQAYALVVTDLNAPDGNFYHWVLYNLPKSTAKLDEGMSKPPAGALVGKNSFGKKQYNGPCPPKGTAHTYVFTLYALDGKLSLPAGADGKAVVAAVEKHTVGKSTFTVTYSRWIE